MSSVLLEIALIAVLLLVSGVCAMVEIAIISSRKGVLQARAEAGNTGAAMALKLAEAPDRFLSTVQIVITFVAIVVGAMSSCSLVGKLAEFLVTVPGLQSMAVNLSWVLVIGLVTLFALVIGELVPKRLATRFPENIASAMAEPMDALAKMAALPVGFLAWTTTAILRSFGIRDTEEARISREEFNVLIREGMVAGGIEHTETQMMEGVLGFEKLDVYDIMIPRPKMVWIGRDESHEEVWPRIVRSTQSFFPVYQGQKDDIVGVVSVKDCYAQLAAGIEVRFQNLMQTPLFVPQTQKASKLLEEFRRTGNHAGFVINEYGGVTGMVTLIDLMEAIVGDVPSKEERLSLPVKQRADGTWLIDGLVDLTKLPPHLEGFVVPPSDNDENQTIAGLFSHQLSRFPAEGDVIELSGWSFEIVDMDGIRVDKVLATRLNTPELEYPGEGI
ncbi:MAG: corC 1 [Akkermansiaceae bacterium]|nr:corC 1 [Akkermansiaceae bacterium]